MSQESPPRRNLTSWFNKKFLQFAQTTGSLSNVSMSSPRHYRTNSSPTYMSPTRSQIGPIQEEFLIGCSVCGSKAIEETVFSETQKFTNSIEDPNSGAYARIVAYYEKPLESLTKSSVELKSIANAHPDLEFQKPFEVIIESKPESPVVKKVVYKEFSPPGKVPLTPLNYEQKNLIKECFYTNPTADKFVKEEERKIVVSRRTEYMHRSNGQVKTFVRTDTGLQKSKLMNKEHSDYGSQIGSKSKTEVLNKKVNPKGGKNTKNAKETKKNSKKTEKYDIKIHENEHFTDFHIKALPFKYSTKRSALVSIY